MNQTDAASKRQPRKAIATKKLLSAVFNIAWSIGIVSWCLMVAVEWHALPDHPVAPYVQPLRLKGVVRYVTPAQEREDYFAHIGFWGAWVVGASALIAIKFLENRQKN